jgi:protein TonB
MKLFVLAVLCSAAVVISDSPPCAAAFAPDQILLQDGVVPVHQKRRHGLRKRAAAPARQPALSEEQAMHSLETELSRKIGLQMKEADYPEEAKRWTWSGITLVHVLVGRNGAIQQTAVGKTSGFRMLDEQALSIVRRISAPSWIPERLRGREVAVLVPIGFVLPHN